MVCLARFCVTEALTRANFVWVLPSLMPQVKAEKHLWHPRQLMEDGTMKRFNVFKADTGRHAMCFGSSTPGDFTQFGTGLVLYFKFLKFMMTLFFVFCILGFPSLVFYALGGKLNSVEVTGIDSLQLTTIGNLGDSDIFCEEYFDLDDVHLECPEGALLGKVEAHFGLMTGSCECPPEDTPLPFCEGFREEDDSCTPSDKSCHLHQAAEITTVQGNTVDLGACCSKTLAAGKPDFSDLDFRATEGCTSSSANRIVNGLCLGQEVCDFNVRMFRNYTWAPNPEYKTWCRGGTGAESEKSDLVTDAAGNPTYVDCSEGFWSYNEDSESCPRLEYDPYFDAYYDDYWMFPGYYSASGSEGSSQSDSGPSDSGSGSASGPGRSLKEEYELKYDSATARKARALDGWRLSGKSRRAQSASGPGADDASGDASDEASVYGSGDGEIQQGRIDPNQVTLMIYAKCFDTSIVIGGNEYAKDQAALLVVAMDLIICITFLWAWRTLRRREAAATEQFDAENVTASDYSVIVRPLPKDYPSYLVLKRRLRKHLEDLLSTQPAVISDHADQKAIKIADIQFGMQNARMIMLKKKRGALLRKMEKLEKASQIFQLDKIPGDEEVRNAVAAKTINDTEAFERCSAAAKANAANFEIVSLDDMAASEDPETRGSLAASTLSNAEKALRWPSIQKVMRNKEKLDKKLTTVQEELLKEAKKPKARKPVVAYVTFADEEGYLRMLATYPASTFAWCVQGEELRLPNHEDEGTHRLIVKPAPMPSDIIWENLEPGDCNRLARNTFTATISLLLILGSMVLLFLAEDSKRENKRRFPTAPCANFGDTLDNRTLVIDDVLWRERNLTIGNKGRLECYCKDALANAASLDDAINVFTTDEFPDVYPGTESKLWCLEWIQIFGANSALTYSAAFGVLVVNLLLRQILFKLVAFERHRSRTEELVSRMTKLFIVQVLNTAFLVLLVNAKIDSDFELLSKGEYGDFTASWYSAVGVSIILTMILNIFVPHAGPIVLTLMTKLKRCRDRGCSTDTSRTKKMTQADLEALYTGPPFLMAERYAQVLTILFVCFSYATGLPMLYYIGCLSMVSFYWVDKYMFTRIVRLPPVMDEKLAQRATSLLPFALILHTGFGMWMLSNSDIFQANAALDDALAVGGEASTSTLGAGAEAIQAVDVGVDMARVTNAQAVPLFLVFLGLLVYMFTERLWLGKIRAFLANFLSCCHKEEEPEDLPPFFRSIPDDALNRSLMQGWTAPELVQEYINEKAYRIFWQVRDMLYQRCKGDIDKTAARHASRRAVRNFFWLMDADRKVKRPVHIERSGVDPVTGARTRVSPVDRSDEAGKPAKGTDAEMSVVEKVLADAKADFIRLRKIEVAKQTGAAPPEEAVPSDSDSDAEEYVSADEGAEGYVPWEQTVETLRLQDGLAREVVDAKGNRTVAMPEDRWMVGLHSYDLRENQNYRNAFYLDSAHIDAAAELVLEDPDVRHAARCTRPHTHALTHTSPACALPPPPPPLRRSQNEALQAAARTPGHRRRATGTPGRRSVTSPGGGSTTGSLPRPSPSPSPSPTPGAGAAEAKPATRVDDV